MWLVKCVPLRSHIPVPGHGTIGEGVVEGGKRLFFSTHLPSCPRVLGQDYNPVIKKEDKDHSKVLGLSN